jgi:diguanylate cyclase (GGDEF)-like protein
MTRATAALTRRRHRAAALLAGPAIDLVLDGARSNARRRLDRRERRVELVSAAAFLAVACALAAVDEGAVPSGPLLAAFVVAYALADRVRLYHGAGFGATTQMVLVPMLYELPAGLVPLVVAAALVAGALADVALRRSHPERLLTAVGDCWYSIGPAAVFMVAAPGAPEIADAGVLAAAYAAQCACDLVAAGVLERVGRGLSEQLHVRVLATLYAVAAPLTAVGLVFAIAASADERAYVAAFPLLLLLGLLARDRTAMIAQAIDRLDALGAERARLRAAIRRTGRTFGVTLDRESLINVLLDTAIDALEADGAAARLGEGQVVTRGTSSDRLMDAVSKPYVAATPEPGDALVIMSRLGGAGTLAVARAQRPFDDDERDLLGYLAAQAGVSMENIALHQLAEERARVDELTGLANHRWFVETVDSEITRARRQRTSVGLLLIDIDDFKAINDGHGHLCGDLVLRELGKLLRGRCRTTDLAARYGGEELAVVLPDTALEGAEELALDLRRAIAQLDIRPPGGRPIRLTASIGVASFPECAPGREALIDTADRALYEAKRTGKNRAVAAAAPAQRLA